MQNKKKLVALVGTVAAGILYTATPQFEGTPKTGYLDPVGIPTACTGHTGKDVILGKRYTQQECDDLFDADMYKHAAGVLMCTPQLKDKPYVLASASDFAFNFGVGAWCSSSPAANVRAGDYKTACVRFNENAAGKPQWVYATKPDGSTVALPGLVKRAKWRRDTCESEP